MEDEKKIRQTNKEYARILLEVEQINKSIKQLTQEFKTCHNVIINTNEDTRETRHVIRKYVIEILEKMGKRICKLEQYKKGE